VKLVEVIDVGASVVPSGDVVIEIEAEVADEFAPFPPP
jgi:hypothetical protein